MKNLKILAVATLMTISSIAMAQDGNYDNREDVLFGLKAGLNYSNVYDSRTESFDSNRKFGFAGGAFLHLPIGTYFGVQPEFLFSQKGFKGTGSIFGSNYSFTRTTSYVDLPIQFAIKPTEFLTILVGPQYSFLVSQKDEFDNASGSFAHEEEFENDNIRKNILGFVAGVDVNLNSFIIGARMGWDMQHNNGDGTSDTPRYKNVWFQTSIGIILF